MKNSHGAQNGKRGEHSSDTLCESSDNETYSQQCLAVDRTGHLAKDEPHQAIRQSVGESTQQAVVRLQLWVHSADLVEAPVSQAHLCGSRVAERIRDELTVPLKHHFCGQ